MKKPSIVFAGTPEFARVSLEALLVAGCAPTVVLTQPDRRSGRGRKLTASPVKSLALAHAIDVWQPSTLKSDDIVTQLAALKPALMVVAAYGLILPQSVLDIPRHGCVNVHASLLPRWRGAAPIQHAILHGDTQTGISLMKMEAGLDTGPVFAQRALEIGDKDTAGRIHDRLAALGGAMLADHIAALLCGKLTATVQDESHATYAGKIEPGDAIIDWSLPAAEIERMVRAYNPVPGARFALGDEMVKCWSAELLTAQSSAPGIVLAAGKDGIDVACGTDALRMLDVQRPGRRKIRAAEMAAQMEIVGRKLA